MEWKRWKKCRRIGWLDELWAILIMKMDFESGNLVGVRWFEPVWGHGPVKGGGGFCSFFCFHDETPRFHPQTTALAQPNHITSQCISISPLVFPPSTLNTTLIPSPHLTIFDFIFCLSSSIITPSPQQQDQSTHHYQDYTNQTEHQPSIKHHVHRRKRHANPQQDEQLVTRRKTCPHRAVPHRAQRCTARDGGAHRWADATADDFCEWCAEAPSTTQRACATCNQKWTKTTRTTTIITTNSNAITTSRRCSQTMN